MKVYVINMERSKHRRDVMDKHLKELGISYELVAAVDGRLLSDEEANARLAVPGSLTNAP